MNFFTVAFKKSTIINYLQTTSSEENLAGSEKGSEQYYGLSTRLQPKAQPTTK